MENLTAQQHKKRAENISRARESVRSCTREMRIGDYIPGQIIYYLGDYPDKMSITPTEYDLSLLKSYAENGVGLIQVHEEWNDTIERYGADKWHSCDPEGMKKFISACHSFGIKIIPYCSSSYIHRYSKFYRESFSRCEKGCVDMHYAYRYGWAGSPEWREFIIPRTFDIMDAYGFDGIFNDWGYDWKNSRYIEIPEDKRNYELEPLERYDPEAEDLIHILYEGVKKRGGIYKLHIGKNDRAPVRGKYYDYLWVGEGEFSEKPGAGKNYEPFLVPCPDKPRLTDWGKNRFDMDAYFAKTIPFVQFPLLTHGRPTMGRCVDVPGVEQYNTEDPHRLYRYFRRVREWADAHPDGPYVYSEWSQIPDDVEDYPRWCSYLALYKPMVSDQSVAHVEIRDSSEILSAIPEDVYISRFSNLDEYLVVSNITGKPYRIELSEEWTDR
ncbi:MAG: hypothetical protein IJV00_09755, partial [Clostridia bacterium]|nr:hypothetical protein [Clostridia bacterium]